jgi:hypothetical protein
MSTLVKDLSVDPTMEQQGTGLDELLEKAPVLARGQRWQGAFPIEQGKAADRRITIRIAADIAFHGPLIEGTGSIVDVDFFNSDVVAGVSLTGTRTDGAVSFELWFDWEPLRAYPFAASGTLSADEDRIDGSWQVPCLCPGECDCAGHAGNFHLEKLAD